ncbi:MAG: hypothetical protein ACK559_07505, partial [bacterium]
QQLKQAPLPQQGLQLSPPQAKFPCRLPCGGPDGEGFLLVAQLAFEPFAGGQQARGDVVAADGVRAERSGDPAVDVTPSQGQARLAQHRGGAQDLPAGGEVAAAAAQ